MISSDGVGIRPIHTDNFDPAKKIGYLINPKLLKQNLSEYELACIKTKRKLLRTICKDKDEVISKNFWTPDYCFVGSYLSQTDTVSLNELSVMMAGASRKSKAKAVNGNFNKHFPKQDKTYHYNHRLKSLNEPATMFIKGVKFVAAMLYQCEYLKRTGALDEYLVFNELIKTNGMAVLVDNRVLQQMPKYEPYYRFDLSSIKGDVLVSRPVSSKEVLPKIITPASQISGLLSIDAHVATQSEPKSSGELSGSPAPLMKEHPTPVPTAKQAEEPLNAKKPFVADPVSTVATPPSNQLPPATGVLIKTPPQAESPLDVNEAVDEGDFNESESAVEQGQRQEREVVEVESASLEQGGHTDMRTLLKNRQISSGFSIQTPSDDDNDSAKQINEDYVNVGKTLKQVLSQK